MESVEQRQVYRRGHASAKYAFVAYGLAFREVVESTLQSDRITISKSNGNPVEALRELGLELAEGTDLIMVKLALS